MVSQAAWSSHWWRGHHADEQWWSPRSQQSMGTGVLCQSRASLSTISPSTAAPQPCSVLLAEKLSMNQVVGKK